MYMTAYHDQKCSFVNGTFCNWSKVRQFFPKQPYQTMVTIFHHEAHSYTDAIHSFYTFAPLLLLVYIFPYFLFISFSFSCVYFPFFELWLCLFSFPEVQFFQDIDLHERMVNILFCVARHTEGSTYRQVSQQCWDTRLKITTDSSVIMVRWIIDYNRLGEFIPNINFLITIV